jgi:hypothetical protein
LIAASESKSVARAFAIKHKDFGHELDDWGNGTPVKYTGRVKYLKPEQEIVFTKIEPVRIRGAWTLGRYDEPDRWIPNPNYVPR